MAKKPLDPRAFEFARLYLVHLDGQKAAIEAGYAPKSARFRAAFLKKHPVIKKLIQDEMDARAERTRVNADRVLTELAPLAFSNVDNFVIDDAGNVALKDGVPDSAMRSVSSIKRKVRIIPQGKRGEGLEPIIEYDTELRLWDKNSALEKAMNHLGMIRQRHELTGKDGKPLHAGKAVLYIPDNHRDSKPNAAAPANRIDASAKN